MRTTHESAHRHTANDLVSVSETGSGRLIYCRLCQRGNSPAEFELDKELVDEVTSSYEEVFHEAMAGDRAAMEFIRKKVYSEYNEKHGKSYHARAIRKHLKDYFGWNDTGIHTK